MKNNMAAHNNGNKNDVMLRSPVLSLVCVLLFGTVSILLGSVCATSGLHLDTHTSDVSSFNAPYGLRVIGH